MTANAPTIRGRLPGVEKPEHQGLGRRQREALQRHRLKARPGLGVGKSGGAQDGVYQCAGPGRRAAWRKIERLSPGPGIGRSVELTIKPCHQPLASGPLFQGVGYLADIGADSSEGVRLIHIDHLNATRLKGLNQSRLPAPVTDHHVRPRRQNGFQINPALWETTGHMPEAGIGIIGATGDAHDGIARTERHDELVGALVERQNPRRGLGGQRRRHQHQPQDQSMTNP